MPALSRGWRLALRRQWRTALMVGVLVGVWVGVALALGAGARRMQTVVARNLAASRASDVQANPSTPIIFSGSPISASRLLRLRTVSAAADFLNVSLLWVRSPAGVTEQTGQFSPLVSDDPRFGTTVERLLIRSGHAPRPDRPNEIAISDAFANKLHVRVGQVLTALAVSARTFVAIFAGRAEPAPGSPLAHLIRLRIAGITAADPVADYLPQPNIYLSRSFLSAYPASWVGGLLRAVLVRLRGGQRNAGAFEAAFRRLPGGDSTVLWPSYQISDRTAHGLQVEGDALELLAVAMLLAGTLALGQFLARMIAEDGDQIRVMRALGLGPRRVAMVALAPAAVATAVSVLCALTVEGATSRWMEFGAARSLEPRPPTGLDLAFSLFGVGLVVIVSVLVSVVAVRAALHGRQVISLHTSSARPRLALTLLWPTFAAGGRLALAPGRLQAPAATRLRLLALGLVIMMLAVAASLASSITHLLATPSLYGRDFNVLAATTGSPAMVGRVSASRSVRAVSAVEESSALIDGQVAPLAALWKVKGSIPLEMLSGHPPQGPDQIVLGTATMRSLHTAVGDTIRVVGSSGGYPMTVVGRAVLPTVGGPTGLMDAADGALVDAAGGRRLLGPLAPDRILLEASPHAVSAFLANPVFGPPQPVPERKDFESLRPITLWGTLVCAIAGVLLLAFALSSATRRREPELALLKTFGFEPRQIIATVGAAAVWTVGLGLIGLPIGLALGRLVWNVIATRDGVIAVTTTPWSGAALLVPAALLVGIILSIFPGIGATRRATASQLRFGE